ncbi:hypothetical protein [Phytomonospora endophytica]|uniref:Uncharacterized protein n=1 Tax=Phytomonospora endophytica TaxID=714109 RepID=A0A841FIA2_9ACTN|nr:hypothetical protein [Phytomonospora endophytica]MBB6032857.1 hypothetical protein [Phytomonospora endophytica]GIG65083.1 hypothetical protein Pen01_13780 [Phytomonospora endophytica]
MAEERQNDEDTKVGNDDAHNQTQGSVFGGDWGNSESYVDNRDVADNTIGRHSSGAWDNVVGVNNFNASAKAVKNLAKGEEIAGSVTDIGVQITDFAANIGLMFLDPIGFLVNCGVSFLIDLVQPLEDLLGLVTGNPERMETESNRWGRVRNALEPLSEDLRAAASEDLKKWDGDASVIAKQRLNELADAMDDVRESINGLEGIMECAKALAAVAQDIIKSFISDFLAKRLIAWVVAASTSGVSFGGSIAVFVAETLMSYSRMMLKVAKAMKDGSKIFQAIIKVLEKIGEIVRKYGKTFAAIKALPGLMGKGESWLRADDNMSNHDVSEALQ